MIKNLLQEGFELKNNGRYKHAIEVFYKALEYDNKSCELLWEIADLYYLIGNYERSISYIEQALEINSTHVESMKLLQKIFVTKKAHEKAEQTAKNIYAITSKPEDLAEILKLLNIEGKYEETLSYESKNMPQIMYQQSKSLYFLNRKEEAYNLLHKAYEIDIENQDILLFLGEMCLENGKYDECNLLMDKLQKDGKNPEILNFLGLMESKNKNYVKAEEYLRNSIKLAPENDEYYYNLANVYFEAGESGLAKKYYNLAISKQPENNYYHYALAKLYYMEKRYKKALEELSSELFDSRVLKAVILCETGYLALARKEINELLLIQPDNEKIKELKIKIEQELGI